MADWIFFHTSNFPTTRNARLDKPFQISSLPFFSNDYLHFTVNTNSSELEWNPFEWKETLWKKMYLLGKVNILNQHYSGKERTPRKREKTIEKGWRVETMTHCVVSYFLGLRWERWNSATIAEHSFDSIFPIDSTHVKCASEMPNTHDFPLRCTLKWVHRTIYSTELNWI